ncbi:MAG: hypothetical protein QGH60_02860 [Phycisphaerae bacterium]|jgi:hypothetical protein|nr:hypothetical protein [Phycisphaerae bacterium]
MRNAICLATLIVCLCGASRGDHHERTPLIVEPAEIAYAKQATWQATMLFARAKVRNLGKDVDLALGSAYARRFWRDFPIRTDWLMQDSAGKSGDWKGGLDGKRDLASYLKTNRDASLERKLLEKVLPECGGASDKLAGELSVLVKGGAGPDDRRWLGLYVKACIARRTERLKPLLARTRKVIFVRHQNMGNMNFAYTEYTRWGGNKYGGLFRLDLDSGAVTELIKTDRGGTIRDPALSYDAKRLLFAWRKDTAESRHYNIYEMELATGKTRLITGADTYGASYEPVYLPDGNIMFNSSRIVQTVDCAGPDVSNLFICDREGKYARRIGFDQVHTLAPTVMDDGRVVYMRWDYNDRSQVYTQAIFQMNPDGTAQSEYYGNNTFEPTNFFHPRGIPGTAKIMCLIGGHHTPQSGKLVVVDPSRGRQGTDGLVEIPSGKKPPYRKTDMYAKEGGHYCYPFPLDEKSLLVSYDPLAYHRRKKDGTRMPDDVKDYVRFHLYYMTTDGRREVLTADHRISSLKPIPVIPRKVPNIRPSVVDYRKKTGVYFVQDIYHGPGLKGVRRGTIKKLRVVELRFREMNIGANGTSGAGGSAGVVTPIAVGTGSWDVKVILGDATVHADGSAMFEVPARTPVYFQALDSENRAVQTMRSWSTLMPGETFSCAGCHEDKNEAPRVGKTVSLAMKAGPQKLEPFYGPPRGFSFPKQIQPILDKHCIECHKAGGKAPKYLLTSETVHYKRSQRNWARSYLTLTGTPDKRRELHEERGRANEIVNWINNSSEPTMIPPRHGGSTRSKLLLVNDPKSSPCPANIKLSRGELDMLAAWIDMVVPYCGDYVEANAWSEDALRRARKRIALNREAREIDLRNIREYIKAGQ